MFLHSALHAFPGPGLGVERSVSRAAAVPKLFSNELMAVSAPERGQTERKEGLHPHAGPMQPAFGNWDLTPDQIPARLLLNFLAGAGAVCTRRRNLASCRYTAISFLAALLWIFFSLLLVWRGCQTPL